MHRAMVEFGANPGRGGHKMSLAAAEAVFRCREQAAKFFHAPDETHVIFTSGCTMSLNMVIKGLLKSGGRALISGLEHNAVWRPLHAISPYNPIYDVVPIVPGNDEATVQAFQKRITPKTKVIICTHASNVFGVRLPIRKIGELAHRYGITFVVDAAQTAGICPIDMEKDHIDYLCVPGHKGLYGPMGIGMLICGNRSDLPSFIQGGTGSLSRHPEQPDELPERLESGTLNLPGICGLSAGMAFVNAHGLESLYEQELFHIQRIYERLSFDSKIQLYTKPCSCHTVPLLSFNVKNRHSEEVGEILGQQDIAVRAGLHCAPLAHEQFGTIEQGSVRIAPSFFTTQWEIDILCKKIEESIKI